MAALAPRVPFDDAIARYIENMGLAGEEAEIVRTRTLVILSTADAGLDFTRESCRAGWRLNWRYATRLGAVRFLCRRRRRSAEEDLWMELAAAHAEEALIVTHVKHAGIVVELLDGEVPPPRSVSVYLDRLEVAAVRACNVYQRTLAQVAGRYLPRLSSLSGSCLPSSAGIPTCVLGKFVNISTLARVFPSPSAW